MYKNLDEYIARLEREGELVRISVPVDPQFEIAELTDRESKRPGGGRALLFEQTGTDFPVVTNLMGSERRMALALGVDRLTEVAERIEQLFAEVSAPRSSLSDKLRLLPLLERMSRWLPREKSGRGACQQVVWQGDQVRLDRLPVLQCWPSDGGRFVTLPLVHTTDPDTGIRNVGMYRMQLYDHQTTGMHWHLHKTGARHYRRYRELGRRMPVAVCLGGDPVYTYAATAPMPDGIDEYLLAGFLRRRPVELVRCLTSELRVPADCDFVIEGYVDPAEPLRTEGPFGDHTGFYSLEDLYPVFHVTAITHRRGAHYPATLVGIPPQEDAYIARATETIFAVPIRRALLPEVTALHMPSWGVAHNLALVGIKRSYPGQGLKVAAALWGAGQMMFNKYMVVLPSTVDLMDASQVAARVRCARVSEEVMRSRGPLDVLDHAAPEMGVGGKLVLDLSGTSDDPPRDEVSLPAAWTFGDGIASADGSLTESWGVLWLFAQVGEAIEVEAFMEQNGVRGVPFVVILDLSAECLSPAERLWLALSDSDPWRDVTVAEGLLVCDARTKPRAAACSRPWPNVAISSAETIEKVDKRWSSYGLGAFAPSPSQRYAPLVGRQGAEY